MGHRSDLRQRTLRELKELNEAIGKAILEERTQTQRIRNQWQRPLSRLTGSAFPRRPTLGPLVREPSPRELSALLEPPSREEEPSNDEESPLDESLPSRSDVARDVGRPRRSVGVSYPDDPHADSVGAYARAQRKAIDAASGTVRRQEDQAAAARDANLTIRVDNDPVNNADPSGLATSKLGGGGASYLPSYSPLPNFDAYGGPVGMGAGMLPVSKQAAASPVWEGTNAFAGEIFSGSFQPAQAGQGVLIQQGVAWTNDAVVRSWYVSGASELAVLTEPAAGAARSALKVEARAMTSTQGQYIAEMMRPIAHEAKRVGGTASKTNSSVNGAMKVAGKAAPVVVVAAAAVSVNEIYNAPPQERLHIAAKETGAWVGAISFGAAGAKGLGVLGLAVGGPVGGAAGAVIGGLGGGAIGAIAGSKAFSNIYGWWNGR